MVSDIYFFSQIHLLTWKLNQNFYYFLHNFPSQASKIIRKGLTKLTYWGGIFALKHIQNLTENKEEDDRKSILSPHSSPSTSVLILFVNILQTLKVPLNSYENEQITIPEETYCFFPLPHLLVATPDKSQVPKTGYWRRSYKS